MRTLPTASPTPSSRRTGGATSRTPLPPGSSQVARVWCLESWRRSNKARAVIESGWQERAANAGGGSDKWSAVSREDLASRYL